MLLSEIYREKTNYEVTGDMSKHKKKHLGVVNGII